MVTSNKASAVSTPQLTPEEFVLKAIAKLRGDKKGIHVVRSGFNRLFREYFGNAVDPVATTTQMRRDGKIAVFLSRGGASLYLRADLKPATLSRHDAEWAERDQKEPPPKVKRGANHDTKALLAKILGA